MTPVVAKVYVLWVPEKKSCQSIVPVWPELVHNSMAAPTIRFEQQSCGHPRVEVVGWGDWMEMQYLVPVGDYWPHLL